MKLLFQEIRRNPLLWLLVFVPIALAAEKLNHEAHTLHFCLSVLAIVPLALLLSHATESVAAKTGDSVGGLLNATLGNLTELVIAIVALQSGEYMLVKASIAGAIVTNSLFMLGASFLLGGLRHHVQEYNRIGARFQASLLFIATVAILIPSILGTKETLRPTNVVQELSVALSVLLLMAYGLGLFFSLRTHRELFGGETEEKETAWPISLALGTLAGVTVFVAPVLVLLSFFVGPAPMDLSLWPGAVAMVLFATLTAALVTSSGRSAWFVGTVIVMIYLMFATTLYLLPPSSSMPSAASTAEP